MKIQELLDDIRKQNLVLPEFQREFVWSKDQAKQLMVSLVKEYPVGSLLFWKTNDPPELKNIDNLPEKLGSVQIILDGQQRLTTLYLLINGEIPPYYTPVDISTDPRELFYNIESGEFQYYQSQRMKGNPVWIRVIDCFSNEINVFQIAKLNNKDSEDPFEIANQYNSWLNRLKKVSEIDLPTQYVPIEASLGDAIDIFDRVNSQGTKLTDAELALTHVTGKWSQARRRMKEKIEELKKENFKFDLNFMTRALTGIVRNRALFEMVHDVPKEELIAGWEKLEKTLDYLVNILKGNCFIHSTDDLNSNNVLIPLIVYLSLHNGKFKDENTLKHACHWLYAAHIWSRYTSQTDQRLEQDVSIVVREDFPWDSLRNQIIDQRGRIKVKADDLEGRGAQHPLYRMTYILAKAYGAIDWFNGVTLGTPHGKAYGIHSHHIFPSSRLYELDYDPDNHLHRKIVNEIGNRAFITAETNQGISNTIPEEYLVDIESNFPGALEKQFIPLNPEVWKIDRYPEFLSERREIIARRINEFMDSLITLPEDVHYRSIKELIQLGESAMLEFKSSLQWDIVNNQMNKELRHEVLKSIAAFLNSAGGTLVLGVEDDMNVLGLENDLSTLKNSYDKFEQLLTNLLSNSLGVKAAPYIKIRFEAINSTKVCVVEVDKAQEPVFLGGKNKEEFYIRFGNTSRSLGTQEALDYIQNNWE